ncbi:YLP motif-containing protein 1 isoform X2 [Tetranychus urticae]|uniref:YLP motif-containing protein 1 isoform X2 n=1 Tax=Tetranychus urticae TaxID=32264 RepID=UPI00077BBF76|nr:YLP motif-containing protein 1 isoform X2 [Tetranychus urticae]
MDSSIGDIDSDPNWVDYLNPTQRQVLEDLKKQQQEFDVHYDEWQKELQTWRAANANHSDPKSYQDYARRWEEWKNKLLSQKNQMERLYKQTLIQLKTQAAKQKEQMNMNMNQHRPMIRQQFTPTSNSQPNFQSHPPMYSQQPYFNQQIAMNSPYFPQQRPFGAIPYQQPRYNQIPQNPMSLPPHLYPGPMPGIMMPPIVQAQANAPVSVFPPLSQQSPAQALPLADHDDRNQGQALHQTQQSSHNQQPNPFQFRGRISTEGLTTIIEPVDDKPKQQTSPEANQRHDPNRRRSDGFHHMEGSNISRPRQPYVAKTIDYDHGSPSIGPSLPPPRGPDSPRGINRAPLRSAIPRGPPPRFGPRPFINNRGPPPQIPPFNRVPLTPPNAPHQGPVFGPHPPPRPTFGARPYFNERPRFGPSFPAGPSQGIPRGPALPPRPNFNQMPPSSNSSSQPPHQRSEIPVKQLTYKDEEYFTAPPSRMVSLEELLVPPTRDFRPKSIVIILRGLPGSGKTHLAKLIRDKETENGGSAPRILSIDDYFMVEKEVMVTDENGKKVKSKEFVYEYEEAMEVSYRASLLKAFKKTTDAPYFKFIIVDAVNSWVSHFHEFHAHAASKGFTVYICEIDCKDPEFCSKRNVHNRTLEEIRKLARIWEKTPRDFIQLDTTTFMQNILTEEADNNSSESNSKDKRRLEETEEDDIISKKLASGVNPSRDEVESKAELSKSRWEKMEESSEIDHDRLDGFKVKRKITMDEYLQLPDDYDQRGAQPNRKRVRWADVEERKNQQKMRNLGFIVGQNWEQVLDPSNPEKALNRTKYI